MSDFWERRSEPRRVRDDDSRLPRVLYESEREDNAAVDWSIIQGQHGRCTVNICEGVRPRVCCAN